MPAESQHLAGFGPALVLPGEVLAGKYKMERVLGAGGWGVVMAARNLQLGQRVAIKLLAHETTPEARARMLREAQAAARIHSDHVVQVYDVGSTESDTPYIVMEYLEGQDLASLLQRSGAVPVALAVHWVLQACEGLAAAQCHGIVHRDLKPANLFLERRPDGSARLKLLDFGIAKVPDATGITEAGGFMGSPAYMAPEQLLDARDVDGRTDVWSLGVVLYELLTRQRPFAADAPLALITKVREQPHAPLSSISSELPDGLSRVVDRCLAKSRAERWQGVGPLARALAPFAPAQAEDLVSAIERVSAGRNDQLTLGSDAPGALRSATALQETRAASEADWDTDPAGLAATSAGPHLLRSRLLLAALVLAALALAFGVLRRQPPVAMAPAPLTPSAVSAAPPPAASPAELPATVTSAEPPAAAPAPAQAGPERTDTARSRRKGSAAPPIRAAAPAPNTGTPPPEETKTPRDKPSGGPLPIDRRGPWQ